MVVVPKHKMGDYQDGLIKLGKLRKLKYQVWSETLGITMLVLRNNLSYIMLANLQRFLKTYSEGSEDTRVLQ